MIWFILALIAAAAGICCYTYRTCFYAPKDRTEDPYTLIKGQQYQALAQRILDCTRRMDEADCQWVNIRSFDGLSLSARYYHTQDNAPVMLIFHGYRSMALRDCAGGFILSKKLGFNVLVPDQRAHAKSQGNVISFGINERRDCLSWIRYINERFGNDTPVVLSGLSMGAATVLMASELELPSNVQCIMADCPYSSPAGIIRKVCADRRIPAGPAYPFIWLSARLIGGFELDETSATEAVRSAKIPILLLHGEDDRFVPCEMSRQIYDACASPARFVTFPDAGHGLCYIKDPAKYEHATASFLWQIPELRKYLAGNSFVQREIEQN